MNPIKKYKISRNSFYPQPKIALSLIDITSRNDINEFLLNNKNREFYLRFLGGIMPYKNKNLVNALYLFLKNGVKLEIKKDDIFSILHQNNIKNNKLNSYGINDFVNISGRDGINATIYLNQSRIWNNGSGICIGSC